MSLDNYLHVNVQVTVVQVYLSIILIGHVGHVGQSNHINVSLIQVPQSASVHIMAVDTHTTVPNWRDVTFKTTHQ